MDFLGNVQTNLFALKTVKYSGYTFCKTKKINRKSIESSDATSRFQFSELSSSSYIKDSCVLNKKTNSKMLDRCGAIKRTLFPLKCSIK